MSLVTAVATVAMINDNTTIEESNVSAAIAHVPAPAPNNNEFAPNNTVSVPAPVPNNN